MLVISEWVVDETTLKIYPQNQPESTLPLPDAAIRILIYLSHNQHRMVGSDEMIKAAATLTEPTTQQQLDQLLQQIGQYMGHNTIQSSGHSNYLLTLPVFSYQYTPVTEAQMKKKLESRRLAAQNTKNPSPSPLHPMDGQLPQPWSSGKKMVAVMLIALLVIIFLAAS